MGNLCLNGGIPWHSNTEGSLCFVDFIFKTCKTRYINFIYSSDRQAMGIRFYTANHVDNSTPIKNEFVGRLNALLPITHHLMVDVLIQWIHESPWRTNH